MDFKVSQLFVDIFNAVRAIDSGKKFSRQIVDQIRNLKLNDIPSLIECKKCNHQPNQTNCISTIPLYRNNDVSINIFVLHPFMIIPMHDHPDIYGLIKVIKGNIRVDSFTIKSRDEKNKLVKALYSSSSIVGPDSLPSILTPENKNLHCIRSFDDCSVFFQVLTPPYDDQKICSYYKFNCTNEYVVNDDRHFVHSAYTFSYSDDHPYYFMTDYYFD